MLRLRRLFLGFVEYSLQHLLLRRRCGRSPYRRSAAVIGDMKFRFRGPGSFIRRPLGHEHALTNRTANLPADEMIVDA
jgi:hypothetical protein